MGLKRIFGFEKFSTVGTVVSLTFRLEVLCLYVVLDIGKKLRTKITITAAEKASLILPDFRAHKIVKSCEKDKGLEGNTFVVSTLVNVQGVL